MATKTCPICNNSFETVQYGGARQFCWECSPSERHGEGASRANTLATQRRAIKKQLVKYKGGECEICGYDKCLQALDFHHTNPEEKDFGISDQAKIKNLDMSLYYAEVDKCQLLCKNCHTETHLEMNS